MHFTPPENSGTKLVKNSIPKLVRVGGWNEKFGVHLVVVVWVLTIAKMATGEHRL